MDFAANGAFVAALLGRPVGNSLALPVLFVLVVVLAFALDDFGGHDWELLLGFADEGVEVGVFAATKGSAVFKQIELLFGGPRLTGKLALVSLFPSLFDGFHRLVFGHEESRSVIASGF